MTNREDFESWWKVEGIKLCVWSENKSLAKAIWQAATQRQEALIATTIQMCIDKAAAWPWLEDATLRKNLIEYMNTISTKGAKAKLDALIATTIRVCADDCLKTVSEWDTGYNQTLFNISSVIRSRTPEHCRAALDELLQQKFQEGVADGIIERVKHE